MKKTTNKRRTIFIILFIVIMIPLLILSRALKHRHIHIERPVGKIGFHEARSDKNGLLLPWTTWEDALKREMNWYYKAPIGKLGFPVYFYSTFIGDDYVPYKNEIIPCTQLGMGILSYLKYWEYFGKSDSLPLKYAIHMGEFLADLASTPNAGIYSNFPRSTGIHDSIPLIRSSQGDAKYGGQVIEPDKGGIAGYAFLQIYKTTGKVAFGERALDVARALAENMRIGDRFHAPWPFRVDAITGKHWGERSGNMVYILRLWDGLAEIGSKEFEAPRARLWQWIKDYQLSAPESRSNSQWVQFFEDMTEEDNRNSWAPLEMARYLIEKKEKLDPDWKRKAQKCINFAMDHFSIPMPGGVTLMGEQDSDLRPWGGACSKLGGVAALFYAAGGGDEYREIALRNLNWVIYFIDTDGGPAAMCDRKEFRKGSWQEDCHTDVVHNFVDALKAVPEFRTNQQ